MPDSQFHFTLGQVATIFVPIIIMVMAFIKWRRDQQDREQKVALESMKQHTEHSNKISWLEYDNKIIKEALADYNHKIQDIHKEIMGIVKTQNELARIQSEQSTKQTEMFAAINVSLTELIKKVNG